jgi:putative lipoic acid-binding regulatory protein
MDQQAIASFKEKLDSQHQWPGLYVFKFIVPADKVPAVKALFPEMELSERASSKGNYTSVTVKAHMESSDQVITHYIEAKKIEGIISL